MNPHPYKSFKKSSSMYASGDYNQINPFAPPPRPENLDEKGGAKTYMMYGKSMQSQDSINISGLDNGGMPPNMFW